MKLSFRSYVRHLRRQHVHVQHIHALVWASLVTGICAYLIFHFDYGLWQSRANESELHEVAVSSEMKSPIDVVRDIILNSKERFFSGIDGVVPDDTGAVYEKTPE